MTISQSVEVWKAIPGYKGFYEVSSIGRVRSVERRNSCKGGGARLVKGYDFRVKERILKTFNNGKGYKYVSLYNNGRRKFSVHKLVATAFIGESKLHIDHINGEPTDNRAINLRHATRSQNIGNSKKRTGCTSVYKGVYWYKRDKKWRTRIFFNGKMKNLGSFEMEIDAAEAYDIHAKKYFESFARTNF